MPLHRSEHLPANQACQNNIREEQNNRVLIDMLSMLESILEPIDLLRLKMCSEHSVHSGKSTGPDQ